VTLLRYWLVATAIILGALAVWALAPVLIFVALLVAALGVVSFAMIWLARGIEARRRGRDGQS
jgi:hypothetical protein